MNIIEILEAFPAAAIDLDNLAWYEGLLVGEVRITRCMSCSQWHHPPGPQCSGCWSTDLDAATVSGRGVVDLVTVLHTGPATEGIDYDVGHTLVSVSVDDVPGVRITAPLVDGESTQVRRGLRVVCDVIRRGGVPTLVFRPASATAPAMER